MKDDDNEFPVIRNGGIIFLERREIHLKAKEKDSNQDVPTNVFNTGTNPKMRKMSNRGANHKKTNAVNQANIRLTTY